MKIPKHRTKARISILVLGAVFILALSCLGAVIIIQDNDYVNVYYNIVGAYAKNPTDAEVKNELLDVVQYYIQHQDVNSNLLDTGPRSGEKITTILDKYGGPCACPPGPCSVQGDACCCGGKFYKCSIVGAALSWQFSGDCIDGCCANACCGGVVATTTTTTSTTTTTKPPQACSLDVECVFYGPKWVCDTSKGTCKYNGIYTVCSDGTPIGQCIGATQDMCQENDQGTGTVLKQVPNMCP